MKALLDDMPVSWSQVANLAGTAARQWMSPRAFGWPARNSAGRLQVVRAAMFFAIAYSSYAIARVIGWKLRESGFVAGDSLEIAASALTLAFAIRVFAVSFFRLKRSGRLVSVRKTAVRVQMIDKEIIVWGILMMPFLVLRNAEAPPTYLSDAMRTLRPYVDVIQVFVWIHMCFESSKVTQRLRRVQTRHLTRRPLGIGPTLGLGD